MFEVLSQPAPPFDTTKSRSCSEKEEFPIGDSGIFFPGRQRTLKYRNIMCNTSRTYIKLLITNHKSLNSDSDCDWEEDFKDHKCTHCNKIRLSFREALRNPFVKRLELQHLLDRTRCPIGNDMVFCGVLTQCNQWGTPPSNLSAHIPSLSLHNGR